MAKKGHIPWNKGRKWTEEERSKIKIGLSRVDLTHTEEEKIKIGLASKGRRFSEESREKNRQSNLGQKRSEETKHNISIAKTVNFSIKNEELFNYLVGVIQGDGCIDKYQIDIPIAAKDEDYADNLCKIIEDCFSIRPKKYLITNKFNGFRVKIASKSIVNLFKPFKQNGLWNINGIKHRFWWLSGLIDTDGYISKKDSRITITQGQNRKGNLELVNLLIPEWNAKIKSYFSKNKTIVGTPYQFFVLSSCNIIEKEKLQRLLHLQHPRKKHLLFK